MTSIVKGFGYTPQPRQSWKCFAAVKMKPYGSGVPLTSHNLGSTCLEAQTTLEARYVSIVPPISAMNSLAIVV